MSVKTWLKPLRFSGKRWRAFTLIEVMVVLVIIVMLLLLASPKLSQWYRRHQVQQSTRGLLGILQYARGQAVARSQPMIVVGAPWSSTVTVFAGQTPLRYWQNDTNAHICYKGSFGEDTQLQFNPNGDSHGQQGRFYVCLQQQCSAVVLVRSGRMRIESGVSNACGH